MKNNQFILGVYVENKSGVLNRISAMLTRRGFNINTLTSGETEDPAFSRITISTCGDEYVRRQIVTQLSKIVLVKKIEILEDEPIQRELMLIKVHNDSKNRSEIMTAVDVFRASVVDYSPESMCIEVTGTPSKIDAFIKLMKSFEIMEICRTGVVALDRGENTLLTK